MLHKLKTSQAIIRYFEQLKIPNDETVQAMKDARSNSNMEDVSLEQLKNKMTQ